MVDEAHHDRQAYSSDRLGNYSGATTRHDRIIAVRTHAHRLPRNRPSSSANCVNTRRRPLLIRSGARESAAAVETGTAKCPAGQFAAHGHGQAARCDHQSLDA